MVKVRAWSHLAYLRDSRFQENVLCESSKNTFVKIKLKIHKKIAYITFVRYTLLRYVTPILIEILF